MTLMSFTQGPMRRFTLSFVHTLLGIGWFAIVILATNPASAQQAEVFLKSNLTVTGDNIRLGDLFEVGGEAADAVVAAAPQPGARVSLHPTYLARAARSQGLIWTNPNGLKRVTISRAAQEVTPEELKAALAAALRTQGVGHDFDVVLTNANQSLYAPVSASIAVTVETVRFDAASGRFNASVKATADGPATALSGRAVEMADVPTLAAPVNRGDVIKANDIVWKRIPMRQAASGAVLDETALVGKAAKRRLTPGAMLRASDVEFPKVVQKGGFVTMVYEAPGLRLTMMGRALEDGAEKDSVAVMNVQTHRTVRAFVDGPNTVRILGPFELASLQ